MDCAHCAEELETGLAKLDGVKTVHVDFMTSLMKLDGNVPFDALQARVQSFGKSLVPPQANDQPNSERASRGGVIGFWDYLLARRETQLALIGGGLILLTAMLTVLGLSEPYAGLLYTIGMAITLAPILKGGIVRIQINREFNINILMSIAAIGAILIGEYLEGATVIFLFAVGEALEGYTADRARDSIRGLMALKPTQAIRLTSHDPVLNEDTVHVNQLAIGDLILVKAGANIPMDGVVVAGGSSVNQAPITGESIPAVKTAGDEVFAGTINGEGVLTVRVTRLAADNTLNRIIALVQDAQSNRAPIHRLVDRVAHYYTPAVVVIAALVAFVPPLVFGAPFFDTATEHGWFYRALAMLVIACPCALVISTPVTVISAITAAARRGVLIKGGAFLEALAGVKVFAFDKTGTLTQGKPAVMAYRSVDCMTGEACLLCDDVLALAAAVERRASHPLAQAVVNAAQTHHLEAQYAPAEAVEHLAGRGVRGMVNGDLVTVGSHTLFDESFPHEVALCAAVGDAENDGRTIMMLAKGQRVRGYVALADEARESSRAVIAELNTMGLATVMLTGDNHAAAGKIGGQVGVSEIRANLLPQDKVTAISELRQSYQVVAMVGDGINDTPALAAANIGIAMGGAGSPQALETADIALLADDLTQLPYVVRLARFTRKLIMQNISISFGMKLVFLILALFGITSLWVAIFADVGISLLVTLNGMRPLRFERQSIKTGDPWIARLG
jgi:Cd2+/Zn2+-exporting ATPase